jgi:hypothetical protein
MKPRSASGEDDAGPDPERTSQGSCKRGSPDTTQRSAGAGTRAGSAPNETLRRPQNTQRSAAAKVPKVASRRPHGSGSSPRGANPLSHHSGLLHNPSSSSEAKLVPDMNHFPPEVQQLLIMKSRNPDLARVSRSLRKGVSAESVYKVFILYALYDNPYARPVRTSHFSPAGYEPLTEVQQLALQKDILECRFCTFRRIKQYLPDIMHLKLSECWDVHRQRLPRLTEAQRTGHLRLHPGIWNNFELLKACYQDRHPHHRDDAVCTTLWPSCDLGIILSYLPQKALAPATWNEEATDYVLFVRQHMLCEDAKKAEFDNQALTRGIEAAIKQHNTKALYTLLIIEHSFCKRPTTKMPQPRPRPNPHVNRPSALLDSFWGLACHQGEHSTWILELLASATHQVIPFADPDVKNWLQGDPGLPLGFKQWLREYKSNGNIPERTQPKSYLSKLNAEFTGPTQCPPMERHRCFG